jgi:GT2 family glycosyltransferase
MLTRSNAKTSVSVTIVTYNSQRFIGPCLEALLQQTGVSFDVVVVDNGSTDGTRDILARFEERLQLVYNNRNLGFAAAQNQAIAASLSDWVLTLNPDVFLMPGFLQKMLEAGGIDPSVGSISGRLLSIGADLSPPDDVRIDSVGIYFTPAMRHFDRGWHQPACERFEEMEYVFGASGAAALYRRTMIDDISENGNFFDPDFFAYREDADVAWRAQLLGWRCLYTPNAVGYHVRSVVEGNRRAVPAILNMHSVKNRFLMRIKNCSLGIYKRYWLPATLRDLAVVGGCLLWEPRSLPAFWHIARCLHRALRNRRVIMARRRVDDSDLARWFSAQPASEPVAGAAVPEKFQGMSA